MLTKRQGLVIWLRNMKNVRKLRKYGHMIYASKKQKYILIYVNQDEIEDYMKTIEELPFVTKVEPSFKPFIKTEYEKASIDKAKEYDIRFGM
ncbi:uncharacterized protein YlbG (UPF0298 family) [Salirhabdus euzebyi]|uniref:UPF0298 protein HNQ94_003498 n=1 Tax=Salirhabdus euzebyi TaxID=394506 RepID=A0A841Q9N2_9BACI|nr:DUF2129 domain-containing protein [Salirhabdus euzebyi]MBB6455004.1 uncharacterized protein YlbG (UPF0298 family) [Salirhabdus euzebyi]